MMDELQVQNAVAVLTPLANPVLIGMLEGREREELARTVGRDSRRQPRGVTVTSHLPDLEARARRLEPRVIVLDERIVDSAGLEEAVRRLAVYSPVVVHAAPAQQGNLVALVRVGEVDFVARASGSLSVVAALVERRLRAPEPIPPAFAAAWAADLPTDFAEILRHEINNPLTGILGNAELLLSQLRGQLAPISVQRLETVVDLAVRLRETTRRLSSEWEQRHASLRSA